MPLTAPGVDLPALPRSLPALDRQSLGMLLGAERRHQGMTQRELEFASGVPQGKISRIERGQSYPPLLTLTQIAGALGLELTITVGRS